MLAFTADSLLHIDDMFRRGRLRRHLIQLALSRPTRHPTSRYLSLLEAMDCDAPNLKPTYPSFVAPDAISPPTIFAGQRGNHVKGRANQRSFMWPRVIKKIRVTYCFRYPQAQFLPYRSRRDHPADFASVNGHLPSASPPPLFLSFLSNLIRALCDHAIPTYRSPNDSSSKAIVSRYIKRHSDLCIPPPSSSLHDSLSPRTPQVHVTIPFINSNEQQARRSEAVCQFLHRHDASNILDEQLSPSIPERTVKPVVPPSPFCCCPTSPHSSTLARPSYSGCPLPLLQLLQLYEESERGS